MWGVDDWGEMIWGGTSLPIPLMSPLGFLVFAVLLIVTGVIIQRRHGPQWAMWTLGAAVVVIPLVAYAGTLAVPNTFTNGTVADADEVNANFDAVETEVNDNDGRITTAQSTADAAQSTADTAATAAAAAQSAADAAQSTADTAVAAAAAAQSTADAAQATADTCYSWGNHAEAGYVLQGQANSITSTMIVNGEVSSSDLQDGATLAEIADDDGAGSGLDADLLDGHHASAIVVPTFHEITNTYPGVPIPCPGATKAFGDPYLWIFTAHQNKDGDSICMHHGLTCVDVYKCHSSSGSGCSSWSTTSYDCSTVATAGRYWASNSASRQQNQDAVACCQ